MSSYLFGSTSGIAQATQNILTYQTERAALMEAHFDYIIVEIEKKIQQQSRRLGNNSLEVCLTEFPLLNHTKAMIDIVPLLSNTERSSIITRISDYLNKKGYTHNITTQTHNFISNRMKITWPKPEEKFSQKHSRK